MEVITIGCLATLVRVFCSTFRRNFHFVNFRKRTFSTTFCISWRAQSYHKFAVNRCMFGDKIRSKARRLSNKTKTIENINKFLTNSKRWKCASNNEGDRTSFRGQQQDSTNAGIGIKFAMPTRDCRRSDSWFAINYSKAVGWTPSKRFAAQCPRTQL